MPKLGLGNASSSGSSMITPGIITDNLVMRHNYNGTTVQPLSDGAAYFDGDNDYIQLSAAISNNLFSFSAWINVTDDATTKTILDTRDGDNDGVIFFISSVERLGLYINNSDSAVAAAADLTAGVWQHIVGTYDGTNLKLYINGVLVETTADAGSSETVAVTTTARIGNHSYQNSSYYKRYISNLGVWSRALTQAEIKSIMWKQYADLSTTETTNLVSWWNLDSTVGSENRTPSSGILDRTLVLDENNNYGTELLSAPQTTGDSGWTTIYGDAGTVITSPSTEQYKGSPNSIKWVPSTGDDGVASGAFTTVTGKIYEISFWGYTTNSGASAIRAKMFRGDGGTTVADTNHNSTTTSTDLNFTVPGANDWYYYKGHIKETHGGSSANMVVTSGGQSSGDYFIDNMSVKEVVNGGDLL